MSAQCPHYILLWFSAQEKMSDTEREGEITKEDEEEEDEDDEEDKDEEGNDEIEDEDEDSREAKHVWGPALPVNFP